MRRDDKLALIDARTLARLRGVIEVEVESENITELFTGFGQRGVRAEAVAEQAIQRCRSYLKSDVPVGEYLADQLLLPLAIAGTGNFMTLPLSRHVTTHIELIQQFLELNIAAEREKKSVLIRVGG